MSSKTHCDFIYLNPTLSNRCHRDTRSGRDGSTLSLATEFKPYQALGLICLSRLTAMAPSSSKPATSAAHNQGLCSSVGLG